MYYPDPLRKENDAEHAFQLALIAWYIVDSNKIPLDQNKIFKLCLAHDLVEVYAGDTPLWGTTGHDDKVAREKEALKIISEKFNEVPDMAKVISEYKERITDEAKFVYALDKLLPFTNQIFTNGRVWKERNAPLEKVLEFHQRQREISPHLTKYFDELLKVIEENKGEYFGKS